ncbi:hypothetical protein ACVNSY_05085 [Bacillus sp. OHL2]
MIVFYTAVAGGIGSALRFSSVNRFRKPSFILVSRIVLFSSTYSALPV